MLKLFSFAVFLTVATAAPQYFHDHHRHHSRPNFHERSALAPYVRDDYFDTGRFWKSLIDELNDIDRMMKELHENFHSYSASSRFEGDHYEIIIPLSGFEEKDIKVKAKGGLLMIQAAHNFESEEMQRNYLDMRTLPSNVDPAGTWTYANNVLTIIFNVKDKEGTTDSETNNEEESSSGKDAASGEDTRDTETIQPSEKPASREEMDSTSNRVSDKNDDADVGLNKSEENIENNRIVKVTPSPIDHTTYAVDLNNEVEFVPVRY